VDLKNDTMIAVTKTPADSSTAFAAELERWGPQAEYSISVKNAEDYCRQLATSHYENFPIVSRLLPRRLRQDFYNVYAFCRWADDLSDEVAGNQRSLELLAWWRNELHAGYEGRVKHPVFVALAGTIEQHSIPRQPLDDLISAFEQDQRVQEYETFAQLHDYCRQSADPVGRLVLYLCGQFTEQNTRWSDSICTGLQLANFWQDVARDFDSGRVYLPQADRNRFGYSQADLQSRVTNAAFLKLMQFEVERARQFLLAGLPLVERLPGRLQINIDLFARGGLLILDRIGKIGYCVWEERPVVTKRDLFRLFAGGLCRLIGRRIGFYSTKHTAAADATERPTVNP
jgi:squalene synthase HpnC